MDFSVICTASLGKENKWTINVYKPFHIRVYKFSHFLLVFVKMVLHKWWMGLQ